jgi:hypothetical protein
MFIGREIPCLKDILTQAKVAVVGFEMRFAIDPAPIFHQNLEHHHSGAGLHG